MNNSDDFDTLPLTVERQSYVKNKLNPWLEAIVIDCVTAMPEDIGSFLDDLHEAAVPYMVDGALEQIRSKFNISFARRNKEANI